MAIARVSGQNTGIESSGSVTSVSKAFSSNVGNGNTVIVGVSRYGSGTIAGADVSDGTNSYTLAVGTSGVVRGTGIMYHYYASGGAITITYTPNGGADYCAIAMHEYSGVKTTSPVDATSSGSSNTGTSLATGNITTTDNDVIFSVGGADGSSQTWTVGSGYTLVFSANSAASEQICGEDQLIGAGTYTGNMTISTSTFWSICVAAFLPAAGGGGATFPTPHLWWSEA